VRPLILILFLFFTEMLKGSSLPPGDPHSPSVTDPIVAISSYFNANAANTSVTLTWNAATDMNPNDGFQGYMILRSSTNSFTNPVDGVTYAAGDILGGAVVMTLIPSSQTLTWQDNTAVPCTGGFYYRIYAYRFIADNTHGSGYDPARGRAYNEAGFGSVQVNAPSAVAPASASADRDNFCADDAGNITLSATGGSGTTLDWYTAVCGGTLLGAGTGPNNSITIPSPAVTTAYYARWENSCGNSTCVTVTVNVLPNLPVSVTISPSENPVCQGIAVTFTPTPVNPGASPVYQWQVNGLTVGTGGTYSYTPVIGDDVSAILTSSASCASGSPSTSNHVIMSVSSAVPVTATVTADPGSTVCSNTTVIYTVVAGNGGTAPAYEWHLNGTVVGTNSTSWSNIPVNGDAIYCKVTSSSSCATSNPVNSNIITITISTAVPVSATISAFPGNVVCAGTPVTYTATAVNGGTTPAYDWFLNGNPTGSNNPDYTNTPSDGDVVFCRVTSSLGCTTGNPAVTNTVTIAVTAPLTPAVSITANPGFTICSGTSVTYTANPVNEGTSPGYEWFIDGVSIQTGSSPEYTTSSLTGGEEITCRMTSSITCLLVNPVISPPVTVNVTQAPVVDLSDKPYLCAGKTEVLDAGAGFSSYLWQDSSTNRYYTASAEGMYRVIVTNAQGCTGRDSVLMQICDAAIYIPAAFSPNGDGLNDLFRVITTQENFTSFSMLIFNRWGEQVFRSDDINKGWDGKVNGNAAPGDLYTWKLSYRIGVDGKETTRNGTITIVN